MRTLSLAAPFEQWNDQYGKQQQRSKSERALTYFQAPQIVNNEDKYQHGKLDWLLPHSAWVSKADCMEAGGLADEVGHF